MCVCVYVCVSVFMCVCMFLYVSVCFRLSISLSLSLSPSNTVHSVLTVFIVPLPSTQCTLCCPRIHLCALCEGNRGRSSHREYCPTRTLDKSLARFLCMHTSKVSVGSAVYARLNTVCTARGFSRGAFHKELRRGSSIMFAFEVAVYYII